MTNTVKQNDLILSSICAALLTAQQDKAFNGYVELVNEYGTAPSVQRFRDFYSAYCLENALYEDLDQSNLDLLDGES